jgi:3-deoxy-D-manno-octulosonic-acid transferase
MWWRSLKDKRYRQRWSERLAFYPDNFFVNQQPSIVFHAVSVGELHAAVPLIRACQRALPDWTFTLTTTTVTGSARVKEIFADTVQHCYLPYDFPGAVKRFLNAVKPQVLVIMETEMWPNLLYYSKRQHCKNLLLNARLSQKSFLNYQKYPALTSEMLSTFDAVAAQFEQDADYFRQLGLPEENQHISGTMKFDQDIDHEQLQAGLEIKRDLQRPVLVAGSTREGEEIKVLEAFRLLLESKPDLLLVLVPRHPDRFSDIADLLERERFNYVSRSSTQNISSDKQVLLGDSLGEMQLYYAIGDIAFVGGSLVNTGCQNIIEPAVLGLPVITGPSLFNFQTVSKILIDAGAMLVVADQKELSDKVKQLLDDREQRQNMAEAARTAILQNRGATEKQQQLILQATHSGQ